ncbi:hypothetical protein PsorP6_001513 [Peronosclerospora sorghi]|uniref:Uncharacterized protein n=1 Tax=Peronosclerospora sorghi TaxID=230839 RepID=A0ACC0WU62_9STRA|nr:hypothetical protein PsorP6_001513 [Peronosclerospora sorghi]
MEDSTQEDIGYKKLFFTWKYSLMKIIRACANYAQIRSHQKQAVDYEKKTKDEFRIISRIAEGTIICRRKTAFLSLNISAEGVMNEGSFPHQSDEERPVPCHWHLKSPHQSRTLLKGICQYRLRNSKKRGTFITTFRGSSNVCSLSKYLCDALTF